MIRINILGGVVLVFSFIQNKDLKNINTKKNKLPVPPFTIEFFLLNCHGRDEG